MNNWTLQDFKTSRQAAAVKGQTQQTMQTLVLIFSNGFD